ncbi:MAG: tetratricopeptide repeat protein [Pyrinomonadaceae bacterium]
MALEPDDWMLVKELLGRSLDLEPGFRAEFLKDSGAKKEIVKEVISLLEYEEESEEFLSVAASGFIVSETAAEDAGESPIEKEIGVYKVIDELGHGGMGAVYLAERIDGKFDQRVAVKMLRREFNTAAIRRRFKKEREIQASLVHPNIAHLLDAGTTEDGVPYIVLEYIEGDPVDEYCERNKLTLNQRLKLFNRICDAVAFAHQKLIVHRDLKPSNILITKDGEPKLLDFGISKLLDEEIDQAHTITSLGAMTPEYASPEQVNGESVTTSTDIYSLGVILYELLTGRRPFTHTKGNPAEIYRAIKEDTPEKPSQAALSSSENTDPAGGKTPGTSQLPGDTRKSDGKNTNVLAGGMSSASSGVNPKLLSGDLDNIILYALRKDPDRRFSTVDQFSADIWRYIDGMPVSARPSTFLYRSSKFIKRNSFAVSVAVLVLAVMIAGIIATAWQARIANAERDNARSEAAKAVKINAFLQNVLNFSNPHWLSSNPEKNRNATVSEAIDAAVKNIDEELKGEPEIQAEVRFTIGKTYFGQGRIADAEKILRKAMEQFAETQGQDSERVMQVSVILADSLYLKGDYPEAEKYYRRAIEYFQRETEKKDNPGRWFAIASNDLGNITINQGKITETEKLYGDALAAARKLSDEDRWIVPIVLANIGMLNLNRGDFKNAKERFLEAEKILKGLSAEPKFEYANVLKYLGRSSKMSGNYQEAETEFLQAYEIFVKNVGEEHQYTAQALTELADVYYLQEKYDKAEKKIRDAMTIQNRKLKDDHWDVTVSKSVLGKILTKTNRVAEGGKVLTEALDTQKKINKTQNPVVAETKISLAENYISQKRYREAEKLLVEVKEGLENTVLPAHPTLIRCGETLKLLRRLES